MITQFNSALGPAAMRSLERDQPRVIPDVLVVGGGRLGTVLGRALTAAGVAAVGPIGRSESPTAAEVAILCLPEKELEAGVTMVRPFVRWVGHTSGAGPLGTADFSVHPMMTFVGTEAPEVFDGIGAAVTAKDDNAAQVGHWIAATLGANAFTLAEENKAAYHAAASIASNFFVTLQETAERVAEGAGLSRIRARTLLAPLVRATAENWARSSPRHALTGPVVRGDDSTIARHRTAISEQVPDVLPLYDLLTDHTRRLAETT